MYLLQHFNIVPIQKAFHELNMFINSKRRPHEAPFHRNFNAPDGAEHVALLFWSNTQKKKNIVLLPLTLFAWLILLWPQMLPGGVQFGLAGCLKSIFCVTLKPKFCFPLPLLCFRRAKMAFAFLPMFMQRRRFGPEGNSNNAGGEASQLLSRFVIHD